MKTAAAIKKKLYEIAEKNNILCEDSQNKKKHIINRDKIDAAYDTLMWCLDNCEEIDLT